MSIKLGWLTGRVQDGGRGETGPRPCEVSEQAADDEDEDDVITHELTGGDLTGTICL